MEKKNRGIYRCGNWTHDLLRTADASPKAFDYVEYDRFDGSGL